MTGATDAIADDSQRAFSHDGGDVGVLLCHGFPGNPGS